MTPPDDMAAAHARYAARGRRARELQQAIDRYLAEDDTPGAKLNAALAAVRKDLVELQAHLVRVWD